MIAIPFAYVSTSQEFLSRVEHYLCEAEGILGRNGPGIGGGYWSRRYVRLLDIRGYLSERVRR